MTGSLEEFKHERNPIRSVKSERTLWRQCGTMQPDPPKMKGWDVKTDLKYLSFSYWALRGFSEELALWETESRKVK